MANFLPLADGSIPVGILLTSAGRAGSGSYCWSGRNGPESPQKFPSEWRIYTYATMKVYDVYECSFFITTR